jgi:hypothetical protein
MKLFENIMLHVPRAHLEAGLSTVRETSITARKAQTPLLMPTHCDAASHRRATDAALHLLPRADDRIPRRTADKVDPDVGLPNRLKAKHSVCRLDRALFTSMWAIVT